MSKEKNTKKKRKEKGEEEQRWTKPAPREKKRQCRRKKKKEIKRKEGRSQRPERKKREYWTRLICKCKWTFLSYIYQTLPTKFSLYFEEKIFLWARRENTWTPLLFFSLPLLAKHSPKSFLSSFSPFFFFFFCVFFFRHDFCFLINLGDCIFFLSFFLSGIIF